MKSLLFTPVRINNLTLKNRIQMSSMMTNYAAANGEVTDRMIHYYTERAEGGCGLIMIEATYVSRRGNSYNFGLGIDDDKLIPGLRRMTDSIHAKNGRVGMQLQHGGRSSNPARNEGPVQLVSFIPGLTPNAESRVMDVAEIHQLVEDYANAALRAKKSGFDLVELHGAHGYIINQFLSPLTNHRTDEYGGSPENRMRFLLEVLAACREAVGPDFPITCRLSVEECRPGGLTLDMSLPIAKALVEAGVDGLNISRGGAETNHYTIAPGCIPEGCNVHLAKAVRDAVDARVPVAVVGRISTRAVAEKILEDRQADIIVMGRALIADPFLPAKLEAGMDMDVVPCLACNEGCAGGIGKGGPVTCAVNARAGFEMMYPRGEKAAQAKHVAVVGAGPAGMEAALVLARRGHRVTLFEKGDSLGGLLNIAKLPPHKSTFQRLVDYYAHALPGAGVEIRLGVEVTAAMIEELAPDMTIVATGSTAVVPGFCRGKKGVVTAQQVLLGEKTGSNCLVVGGGLVGSETAEFLVDQGKKVTILELRDTIAPDMENRARRFLLPRLQKAGVTFLLQTEVVEISDEGVVRVRDPRRKERSLKPFDSIVLALGYRPCNDLYYDLVQDAVPCREVGDCLHVGKVLTAVQDAHNLAWTI